VCTPGRGAEVPCCRRSAKSSMMLQYAVNVVSADRDAHAVVLAPRSWSPALVRTRRRVPIEDPAPGDRGQASKPSSWLHDSSGGSTDGVMQRVHVKYGLWCVRWSCTVWMRGCVRLLATDTSITTRNSASTFHMCIWRVVGLQPSWWWMIWTRCFGAAVVRVVPVLVGVMPQCLCGVSSAVNLVQNY
jgi:hypothetical protein